MSQLRPLSLIAIVAWSLVVCWGYLPRLVAMWPTSISPVISIGRPRYSRDWATTRSIEQSGQNNTATQTQIGKSNQAKINQAGDQRHSYSDANRYLQRGLH